MSFALNEVEALAKRATRGAGYPWGMAEEAAKATRWLCAQGQDGCTLLAALLQEGFGPELEKHVPDSLDGAWQGQGALCPLATGASLSDMAATLEQSPVTLRDVKQPALLLPFAASAARRTGAGITVTCGSATAATDGRGVTLTGVFPDQAALVTIETGAPGRLVPGTTHRATPPPAAWEALNQLAHRTYAPATEESRRLGAGAGLSDND